MILLLAFLFAAPDQQVYDLMASVASALSDGNNIAFRDAFAEGHETLLANVDALLARADVYSSIDFLKNEGDDKARTLELDWFLQIREKADNGALLRRRQIVTVKVEKRGKKWKIVSLAPQSLFAP